MSTRSTASSPPYRPGHPRRLKCHFVRWSCGGRSQPMRTRSTRVMRCCPGANCCMRVPVTRKLSAGTSHRTLDPPDWWAVQLWIDLWAEADWVAHNEDRIREGILALVATFETDDDLDYLAAAVMEVFATDDDSRLRWIEENAASSEKFRQSLRNVWAWELPDSTYARFERAAGVALRRPDREEYDRRMGRT